MLVSAALVMSGTAVGTALDDQPVGAGSTAWGT